MRKRRKESYGKQLQLHQQKPLLLHQRRLLQQQLLALLLMQKKSHFGDTQRIGREDVGYINVPKDWIVFSNPKYPDLFRYSSPDKYNILLLKSFSKEQFKLNDGEPWGAKAVANRMYVKWKDDKQQTSLDAVKTKFAGEEAFLLKVTFTDGKTLYDWFFLKGDLVYRVAIEGSEETINSLRPILQNTWSLDSKSPRQY